MKEHRHRDKDGKLHRETGPAVISSNESKVWYLHGKRHREDGPAVIRSDGSQEWYLQERGLITCSTSY